MADDKGSRLVSAMKGVADYAKEFNKSLKESVKDAAELVRQLANVKDGGASGGGSTGANQRSTPSAAPSTAASSGEKATGLFAKANIDGIGPGEYKRTKSFGETFGNVAKFGTQAAGQLLGAAAMALPTGTEAVNTAANAERLRFYGLSGGFGVQRRMSAYGSPTDAMDAVSAATMGAGVGLLPGLQGYGSDIKKFGGILGGAALASNLLPGMGLQGGMNVMASLNRASSVNLLRMVGIDVRTSDGTTMQTLPNIIAKLYKILKNANGGQKITPRDIAISAMSGNALDSILNQYFSGDENLRQVVLAGLMQMANVEARSDLNKLGDLSVTGSNEFLRKTGGSISTTGSMAKRYTSELKLIQQFTDPNLKGIMQANDILDKIYGGLGGFATNTVAKGAAGLLSTMETIGGARGGAGALLLNAGASAAQGLLPGTIGGLLGTLAVILGAQQYGEHLNTTSYQKFGNPDPKMLWSGMGLGPKGTTTPDSSALLGNNMINVYAYTKDDASILGHALANSLPYGTGNPVNTFDIDKF